MNVAGELVEHDHQGERLERGAFPGLQPSRRPVVDEIGEAQANLAVEIGVLVEPDLLGPAVEPEIDDLPGPLCCAQAATSFCFSTRWIAGRADTSSTSRATFLFTERTSLQAWRHPVNISTGRSATLKRSPAI